MTQTYIRFDWAIKKLLRNKANFDILEGFLSELLKEDVFIQEIIESEGNKDSDYDKSNRVDIMVKNTEGLYFLIEIQNEKEHDYFHRMSYGQAKAISERLNSGDKYDKVVKVYSVNIVYFELGHGDDYVYLGETIFKGMHTNNLLELSKTQKELYHAQLPQDIFTTYYLLKVNNINDIAKDALDEWIYFLKNSEIKDGFKAKGLAQAKEKMRVDSMNDSEREAYEEYVKIERIRLSEIDTAIEDGKELAKQELLPQLEEERKQKEEERRQKKQALLTLKTTILNLQASGFDNAKIAVLLGKSEEEITRLLS